ncbi:MAG: hypothetical protein ACK4UN_17685, partial [Limisphaerales bacterium]
MNLSISSSSMTSIVWRCLFTSAEKSRWSPGLTIKFFRNFRPVFLLQRELHLIGFKRSAFGR